ncbi:MAG: hypothetical protein K8F25_11700 [Fimbriimonadaceae bacterium]|nr:hypothetical protein [Alphaproteobacteria bacterium]
MQLTNVPAPDKVPSIVKALQEQRVNRYLPPANGDPALALSLYMWNYDLSEAFQFPLHVAEISCRNAIHNCLLDKLGDRWFEHSTFRNLLDRKFLGELDSAIAEEADAHGAANVTCHHVVSGLMFGFWEHLTTKRFDRLLWIRGIYHSFPNAPPNSNYRLLQSQIELVRRWRNRIAHHKTIFDKQPNAKFKEISDLIRWVCNDTADWVVSVSRVTSTVNLRPVT